MYISLDSFPQVDAFISNINFQTKTISYVYYSVIYEESSSICHRRSPIFPDHRTCPVHRGSWVGGRIGVAATLPAMPPCAGSGCMTFPDSDWHSKPRPCDRIPARDACSVSRVRQPEALGFSHRPVQPVAPAQLLIHSLTLSKVISFMVT